MCCWQEWIPEAKGVGIGAKRRLREIQQLQIASVCLGIEHLMNKRRRATTGAGGAARARVSPQGQQTRPLCPDSGDATRPPHHYHHHPQRHHPHQALSCRLCDSTLRVLSIARAHRKRCRQQQRRYLNHTHDTRATAASSCEACQMWSMVGDRCASLGISLPGDMFGSVGGGGLSENGFVAPAPVPSAAVSALPGDAGPVEVRGNTPVANE